MAVLRPTLLASSLLTLLPAVARAELSDAEVRSEIAFARGLAAEWSFVDLANDVIQRVEREGVSERMSEQLDLVKCDVYAMGARAERDPERRNQLFDEALEAYLQFIDRNPYSDARSEAEAAYVDTAASYSRYIDMTLEEAVGEEVDALTERKVEVLMEAVGRTADLIAVLEEVPPDERSEHDTRQLYELMLDRGDMLADLAVVQEDGQFFYDQAISTLEDLVFDAGEGTPFALRAYAAIGKVYAAGENYETAASYYQAVVDQTIPADPELWKEIVDAGMTNDERALRFYFVELAISGFVDASLKAGDLEHALEYGLHFYNTQRREGFNFTPQGYVSLLATSRALLEAGGFVGGDSAAGQARWFETEEAMDEAITSRRDKARAVDLALQIAQTVNEDNKGNVLQVRAQNLISEIIERPGVEVSPDILLQAAEGRYNEQAYAEALVGYDRVLDALMGQDEAQRLQYGAQVMNGIGNCYRRMERPLEAAMAFREGVTTWVGDPEFDSQNAQGFYTAISAVVGEAVSQKGPLEALLSESEQLVAKHGAAKRDEVLFNIGKKEEASKDYDKAIATFRQVEEGSDYWEKALVEIAYCKMRQGQADEALAEFDRYLNEIVPDPKYASTSPIRQAKRREATAMAEFFRGYIHFARGEQGDRAGYEKVIELLPEYWRDYPDQTTLSPWTMRLLVISHVSLGQRPQARAALDSLNETYPESEHAGLAAVAFYRALSDAYAEAPSPEEKRPILVEMAEHLARANELSSSPSFANLRLESQHWLELGEWAKAEAVLRKIADRYAGDAENTESIERYVLPDLGHALLAQKKVAEAKQVLSPLLAEEAVRPSRSTVLDWCRSVSGWLEEVDGQLVVVPGAAEAEEEFQLATSHLNGMVAAGTSWVTCDWYLYKFMALYTYAVWGETNSRQKEYARGALGTVITETGADFAAVDRFCSGEDTPEELRRDWGDGKLRARYQWLDRHL